jgi:hypothetical protein
MTDAHDIAARELLKPYNINRKDGSGDWFGAQSLVAAALRRAAADAAKAGRIEGLEQARGIVRYHGIKPLLPAARAMLEEVDVFLRANIERGGYDGTVELMSAARWTGGA